MKIYLDMVGCRLNQSELEEFARQFTAAGHTLTGEMAEADAAVVNTCTVTVAAAADSRKLIRRIARSGVKQITATGCWVTMQPEQAEELPGVVHVVDNTSKSQVVSQLLALPLEDHLLEVEDWVDVPGSRQRTRAFIKTQDGCSHHCTFCVTTLARGCSVSTPAETILQQIDLAVNSGVKEVVLTGVQLGSWGHDFESPQALEDLVSLILSKSTLPRLRLSSIEPWDVTPDLVDLIKDPRVARHLHLPLQSGSAQVLRKMARAITPQRYAALVDHVRSVIPRIAVTTDLMAGFPGESEAAFQESLDFIRSMKFADGHVFTYSAREQTPAAEMENQVPHPVRKVRNALIRKVLTESRENYISQFIGQEQDVLWESSSRGKDGKYHSRGLTDNYLRVETWGDQNLTNQIRSALLLQVDQGVIQGQLLTETSK